MEIAVVDIMVPHGGEYDETFVFYEDEAKTTPKDLGVTGWSGKIVIRDKEKQFPAIVSTTVDTTDAANGRLRVWIPTSVSEELQITNHPEDALVPVANYVYAVIVEDGNGVRRWLMRGNLSPIPDPEK
ncbi:hypothetical protein [Hydrogenimonas sp.]